MAIIVTGGAGFIGSHVVDKLLALEHEVVALDNFDPFYPRARKEANLALARQSRHFRLVELDIRDRHAVHDLVERVRPEAVIHLAARAGVRPSIDDPAGYVETNVNGTTHLLEAVVRLGTQPRFVFASSSSVYGDRAEVPFRETDSADQPVSPYAASKRATELLAHAFHHLHGMPTTGLRFFTAYGPRNRPDLAIARFADLLLAHQPVPMFGDGSTQRDYTYVEDIADGVVRALQRSEGYRIFNLGNSEPVALRDMIAALGRALGIEPTVRVLPEQPGDVRQTYADIARARFELGYDPGTSLDDGLRRFVAWRREQVC